MPKRKSTARDDRARARRSRLPDPDPIEEQEEEQGEQSSETPPLVPPPPNAFTFKLDHFTADCFVDTVVMLANEASIVRGSFLDAQGRNIRVDVPTTAFFDLHVLEPTAAHTWSSLNLEEFFALPAWGPDLQRSWELLSTLQENYEFTVSDFRGNPRICRLTRDLVRQALALPAGDTQFNERGHNEEQRYQCADVLEPRWDELKLQIIRLPLQIYMQFFHFPYPHRWSVPEKSVAVEFTLKQAYNRETKKDFAQCLLNKIMRAAKSAIVKGSSEATRKMRPYLGGVLVLTKIAYAALGIDEFPEPWEKPELAGLGSKTIPGSRPSKSDKSRTSRSSKKREKSSTHKAQSHKSPPHPEDDFDSQELRDALELSKSDGAGTSKLTDLGKEDTEEERALREAIRRSLVDMGGRTTALPRVFTCSEEGSYVLSQDEAETLRETLIALSQDTGAVISLHEAITVYRQERLRRDEVLNLQEEAKEQEERERKRKEYEEEMKKKGKEKVGEGSIWDEEDIKPPPPTTNELLAKLRESHATMTSDLNAQLEEEERLGLWGRMQDEQDTLLGLKDRFDQGSEELIKTFQEDEVFALEVATQLHMACMNIDNLQKLVSRRSTAALEVLKDNGALLDMIEESAMQVQANEVLDTQQALMNELLARHNKLRGEATQWEKWCAEAQAKVGELRLTNTKLSELLREADKKTKTAEEQLRIQTTAMQSRSGSIGVGSAESATLGPVSQEVHNEIVKALESEINENVSLRTEMRGMEEQIKALKEEMERLKSSATSTELPRQLSPIREEQEIPQQTQHTSEAGGSGQTEREPAERTYTLKEGQQWQLSQDYFMELKARQKKLYWYEREIYELSKLIPLEKLPKTIMPLDRQRLQVKIDKEYADWEFAHPEQTRGGYKDGAKAHSKEVMEVQPSWRLKWFRQKDGVRKIYTDSPRQYRIDPTYCPTPRRYSWADFEKKQERNASLLNFPKIASPASYTIINDAWMAELCNTTIAYFEGVPDFTVQMFCKFLRLLETLLTCFEKEKRQDPNYYRYHFGSQQLAWDLNMAPLPQQVHGLYQRVRFLRSCYVEAFEEMMLTGFIEGYTSSCFGPNSNINEIFVQRRLIDAELPYLPPDLTDPEELKKQQEMYRVLHWIHIPQQRRETTNQDLLTRINQIGAAVQRLESSGRGRRGRGQQERAGRGRQMRGAIPPPPQPQQRPLMGLGRPAAMAEGIPCTS